MFKRVERKRKRQEEEEELGIDEDMKEIMGLNDTDSDESDDSDGGDIREDSVQEEEATSEEERVDEEPISVAEALKDPIYLISLNPTVYGCVLCKGKLIKNAGMATAHKNANAHMRRFEHFRGLSADADPSSNAWELVRSISSVSNTQSAESQDLSKRTLKRQVKFAALREKRKRHKDLKRKAMAKKALEKLSMTDEAKNDVPSSVDSTRSPVSKIQSENPRKRQKLNVAAKSASRAKISNHSKKSTSESRHRDTKKGNRSR